MRNDRLTADWLAEALLVGPLDEPTMNAAAERLLGKRYRWFASLAERIAGAYTGKSRPRAAALADFIAGDKGFRRAARRYPLRIARPVLPVPEMTPMPAAAAWRLPELRTPSELAVWLGLTAAELDWFADPFGFEAKRNSPRLRHYRYRVMRKPSGGVRIVEAPKPRLKAIQRQILAEVLDRIPPAETAHGFRKGRSVATFAAPHQNQHAVLKIDLEDFFPSIAVPRVRALFRSIGYPEAVANHLAALCTNSTPPAVAAEAASITRDRHVRERAERHTMPHLPQGAPTSPAIANLCAYRLDQRLASLAESARGVYTRYADDLAFSGDADFSRRAERLATSAHAIVIEEGFRVNFRKTRVMRRGGSQRIAGLVVNQRLGFPRADRDRLKATLTNCVRLGPATQNRANHADFRGHLAGRVAYAEWVNPAQGRRLRRLFERIKWGETS